MESSVDARRLGAGTAAALALLAALSGCSDQVNPADEGNDAPPSRETVVTLSPDAPPLPGETECKVVITTGIPVTKAKHVPVCTPVTYATNPPSGGDHWPVWADFKAYEAPVPREMYVHDLEHGAVVLAYRCASSCPAVTSMLESVRAGATSDPRCLVLAGGPNARIVSTPDPELATPIAAAAWGATYTATCIDKASLAQFVAKNYGKGTEDLCAPGKDTDAPDGGAPRCDGEPDGGAPDAGPGDGGAPEAGP